MKNLININNLEGDFQLSMSQRIYINLKTISESLEKINKNNLFTDLSASEIQLSIEHLRNILGNNENLDPEEILNSIFSSFCIGK